MPSKKLFIWIVFTFNFILVGCSTTIQDKHKQLIANNPNQYHYVTVAPFSLGSNYQESYQNACLVYNSYPKHSVSVDKTWYKFEQGLGGQNQTDLESFALKQCETKHKQACVVLIYNENYDRCRFTFNEVYVRALSFSEEAKQADALKKQAVQKQKEIELMTTCESFGFKKDSNEMRSCIFDLYKLNAQIEAIRNASATQAAAISTATDEARKLREFEQGMMLLRGASANLSPATPNRTQVNCSYNPLIKTINCR